MVTTFNIKREEELRRIGALVPLWDDPFPDTPGVLCSNQIKHLCTKVDEESRMIAPFDPSKLHPASCKLTIGNEFFLGSKQFYLGEEDRGEQKRAIEIPPFQVAIIRTRETLCIPRFVIARWNIAVKRAYEGLLWVGGPQVDPGWRGHLCCPIYNLSSTKVVLREGEDIALMDFVKLTPVPNDWRNEANPPKSKVYPMPKNAILLEDYPHLDSALFTDAAKKIDDIEKNQSALASRFTIFTGITMGALAAIPALLASVTINKSFLSTSIWGPVAIFLSAFAILLVLLSGLATKRSIDELHMTLGKGVIFASVLFAFILSGISFFFSHEANSRLLEAIRLSGVERISTLIDGLEISGKVDRSSWMGGMANREELLNLEKQINDLKNSLSKLEPTVSLTEKDRKKLSTLDSEIKSLNERLRIYSESLDPQKPTSDDTQK